MIMVTADPTMQAALESVDQSVEIRDGDGKVIGYFTPVSRTDSALYSRAAAHFDPMEMKRRKESGEVGCTTEELLRLLETEAK
ncbi:MAG: hypothetical protein WD066_14825 [Planctomycetaceae bacterium]